MEIHTGLSPNLGDFLEIMKCPIASGKVNEYMASAFPKSAPMKFVDSMQTFCKKHPDKAADLSTVLLYDKESENIVAFVQMEWCSVEKVFTLLNLSSRHGVSCRVALDQATTFGLQLHPDATSLLYYISAHNSKLQQRYENRGWIYRRYVFDDDLIEYEWTF